jgi:hypothetical protein
MTKALGSKYSIVSITIFATLSIWWLLLQFTDLNREVFSASYCAMAFWGGILGLIVSEKWGGSKSSLGFAVLMLAIGLLLQVFGQLAYSVYYYVLKLDEVPYPSIGDVGFFGSIFFYIAGAWFISTTVGIKYALKDPKNKILAVLIPLFALVSSYYFFVQGQDLTSEGLLITLLNLGYPLGQSIYVGIAALGYFLSRKLLGGSMRGPLSLLLLSLILQYASDFVFLYQTYHETWVVGGINEYMYLISYFVMAMALVSLYQVSALSKSPRK